MVAINSLPRQDSTWIKVSIKEKCRVLFYDQTSSDTSKKAKKNEYKNSPPPHTQSV